MSPSVVRLGGDPLVGLLLGFFGIPVRGGGPLHDDAGVSTDNIDFALPSSSSLSVGAAVSRMDTNANPLDTFLQQQTAKGR